jgi:hypothetical protein
MNTTNPADRIASDASEATARSLMDGDGFGPFDPPESPAPGTLTVCIALLALVLLWAVKVYSTWARWGNLTIDSGHEMYIPGMLAHGKMLYRDVWFLYGPASEYFNSLLFRLFGERLEVLYWAGSLSALGSAVFLWLAGMRLSCWHLGWSAGAAVLLEAFQPSLFCFPLPYSFAAVYGCLVGCLFLWMVMSASRRPGWGWMFGAGSAAAAALLLKMEFGTACYATLALLILAQCYSNRSWRPLGVGFATSLPGAVCCALVIRWMVSIAGVEFITQENIMSWPTSYFMKTYGRTWLARNGFTLSASAFGDAALRAVAPLGAAAIACSFLWWRRTDRRANWLRAMLVSAFILFFAAKSYLPFTADEFGDLVFIPVFFPLDMVLYVAAGMLVAWWYFLRQRSPGRNPAIPLLLSFASLLAFRILMGMRFREYAIYYNGPVILAFLWLASRVIPRSGRSPRFVFLGQSVICLGCLTVICLNSLDAEANAKDYVPLTTERGIVRASPHLVKNYEAAIRFMKEKAALGESVLSVPEDTSLYFLSGTECPTRVFAFTPGSLAPGKMTEETIRQIEQKRVRYLLWSNRIFPEYGAPVFGVNFDRELGDYLKSHYRPVERLLPPPSRARDWTAVAWERKPEEEFR